MPGPIHAEVHISINRKPKVSPNPTAGAALYTLGEIPAGYDLFLEIPGPGDDEFIPNTQVNILLKEGAQLFSAPSTLNPGARLNCGL